MAAVPDTDPNALDAGTGFAVLEDARITRVAGADARGWLHDLVTTDVASLEPGRSRPSLLLTPTGRIRAMFHVVALDGDAFALIEPHPSAATVATTLAPYVLSSDVEVDATSMRVVAVPGLDDASDLGTSASPSMLGDGCDLLVEADDVVRIGDVLRARGLVEVDAGAVERRRVRRGEPRLGHDLDTDALPAEAGLDVAPVTDRTKGCFLGQEAIAKVANLGHPTRLLLRVRAARPLQVSETVLADGEEVGAITSAADRDGLARVAWAARGRSLAASDGTPLEASPPPGGREDGAG